MQKADLLLQEGSSEGISTLKIERPQLHDLVVERLRDLIVEGRLEPGAKLNERELCQLLDVSRTPLREALKVLAAESLIEIHPNRGAVVSRLSVEDIQDTFELIGALEAFAGELACARMSPEELDEINALHGEMVACRGRNDLPGYYRRNQAIHDKIVDCARNAALQKTYSSANRRIQALRFRSNVVVEKWDRAVVDHERMLRALEARDAAALAAILRGHLSDKRDVVLQTLGEPRELT